MYSRKTEKQRGWLETREYYYTEEIEWLNQYHAKVFETLAPYLNEEERAWLAENTAAVKL